MRCDLIGGTFVTNPQRGAILVRLLLLPTFIRGHHYYTTAPLPRIIPRQLRTRHYSPLVTGDLCSHYSYRIGG